MRRVTQLTTRPRDSSESSAGPTHGAHPRMNRFERKIALVTGGTSGIGRATVQRLLDEGATVIATASTTESAARAQAELGDAATVLAADALDLAAQRRVATFIAERFGALDVLVLNAGVSDWRPLEQWDEDGYDRVF